MPVSAENMLAQIENDLRAKFSDVKMEFATQSFAQHAELWVYVIDLDRYSEVNAFCQSLAEKQQLDKQEPEIWLLAKTWSGPWPGGESEQEVKRKRKEFRNRHSLV